MRAKETWKKAYILCACRCFFSMLLYFLFCCHLLSLAQTHQRNKPVAPTYMMNTFHLIAKTNFSLILICVPFRWVIRAAHRETEINKCFVCVPAICPVFCIYFAWNGPCVCVCVPHRDFCVSAIKKHLRSAKIARSRVHEKSSFKPTTLVFTIWKWKVANRRTKQTNGIRRVLFIA